MFWSWLYPESALFRLCIYLPALTLLRRVIEVMDGTKALSAYALVSSFYRYKLVQSQRIHNTIGVALGLEADLLLLNSGCYPGNNTWMLLMATGIAERENALFLKSYYFILNISSKNIYIRRFPCQFKNLDF